MDDGLINQGYRITDLFVWCGELADGNCKATLSSQPKIAGSPMDAGINTEIAWASFVQEMAATSIRSSVQQDRIVDLAHIINRDLYLTMVTNNIDLTWNYMIVMEKRKLSDDEAILAIIREEAQDVGA